MTGWQLFKWLVAAFVGLIAATVVAGFLAEAVGVWASVLWGLALVSAVAFPIWRRRQLRA